jgi:NADH-quinone oxidoreductase subunit K
MLSIDSITHVGLNHYLILSALLFATGMAGVLLRRNVIVLLMSIELMLNAVNITFVAFSRYLNKLDGQVLVFFVMTIAAAEAAVGLAIAVSIFKRYKEVNIRFFEHLKG